MQLEHSILKGCCPQLAVIDVAARVAGYPVSSVEVALKGAPRSCRDKFTLQHVAEALSRIGVGATGFRLDATGLGGVGLPMLAQVKRQDIQEFAVVTHVDEHSVLSYSGHDGWWLESRRDFIQRWSGIYLALNQVDKSDIPADTIVSLGSTLGLRLVDAFLDAEECEQLVREAAPLFRRSMVSADGNLHSEVYSSGRTSQSAMFSSRLCARIVARAASLSGQGEACFEPLQCVKYEVGQKFSPHYDVPIEHNGGNCTSRVWTMLAYLNDGFEGGETLFPLLDLRVRPTQGGLIMFRNRRAAHGEVEASALHAGMPVARGTKYACNIWCSDNG